MYKAFAVATMLLMPISPRSALADGLLYQLPKDGTWARFEVVFSQEGVTTNKAEVTLSVVGSVDQNGQMLHWIELKHPLEGQTGVVKVLIPEKQLEQGGDPLNHVVRGWRKRGKDGAEAISQANNFWLQVLLPGPLSEVKQIDNAVVTSKLGELECKGLAGNAHVAYAAGNFSFEHDLAYEVRRHKKAPFGVVACHMHCKLNRDGKRLREMDLALKLIDFGTGGKSELPGYE